MYCIYMKIYQHQLLILWLQIEFTEVQIFATKKIKIDACKSSMTFYIYLHSN